MAPGVRSLCWDTQTLGKVAKSDTSCSSISSVQKRKHFVFYVCKLFALGFDQAPPLSYRNHDSWPVGMSFNLSASTSFSSLTLCECQDSSLGTKKEVENLGKSLAEETIKLLPAKGWCAPTGLDNVKTTPQVRIGYHALLLLQPYPPNGVTRRSKTCIFPLEMSVCLLLDLWSWFSSVTASGFQSSERQIDSEEVIRDMCKG